MYKARIRLFIIALSVLFLFAGGMFISKLINSASNPTVPNTGEVFYGTWIIADEIASGNVVALDDEQIGAIIGQTITYTAEEVRTGEAILQTPSYKKEVIPAIQFQNDSLLSIQELGIQDDYITEVTLYRDEKLKNYGFHLGRTVFLTDNDDQLILFYGNVYFLMER